MYYNVKYERKLDHFFLFMKSNYFFLWNAGDVVTGSDAQVSVPVQTLTDLQGTITMAT